jgi:hypothetical protein
VTGNENHSSVCMSRKRAEIKTYYDTYVSAVRMTQYLVAPQKQAIRF